MPTILARMAAEGVRVAAVTAKDKLRKALATGLNQGGPRGIAFSAQNADAATLEEHGISAEEAMVHPAVPGQYSPELSLFVLDAGIRLVARNRADLIYLSLSDFVQHAHAPGAPESDAFIEAVDERVARLIELGATVGIVVLIMARIMFPYWGMTREDLRALTTGTQVLETYRNAPDAQRAEILRSLRLRELPK